MPRRPRESSRSSSPGGAREPARVGVWAEGEDEALRTRAEALARELGVPLAAGADVRCDLLVAVTAGGLVLRSVERDLSGGIRVDFEAPGRRLATASRRQPLARAVGLKKSTPTVIDATAGLGRDALFLATLGCPVLAIERNPVLGAMLGDALERMKPGPVRDRLRVRVGEAIEILRTLPPEGRPAVVYLDPMFPPRGKSALPKKEMRLLRRLVGDDPDAADLLAAARRVARTRVVVKRTPHAPPLAPDPSLSVGGKLVRFDVYLTGSGAS